MKNTPKPVKEIELSEQNVGLRIAVVVILIIVAVTAFVYGISEFFKVEEGWTEIEANSSAETNLANEFVFMYNLGSRNDMSITEENKKVISIYTDTMVKAYKVFHDDQEFENVSNVYYINAHPNVEIEVDEMLYQAFALIQKYGNRNIYLAPIYEQYDDIFYCEDDSQIISYDPYLNKDVADVYSAIAAYANNTDAVNIQLCGNNKIKLCVSDEYKAFCEENDITKYIDFSWMTNSFVLDYLADLLIQEGYTAGCISSYDGFVRNLDESGTKFSLNIFHMQDEEVLQAATMEYINKKSIVVMRNYPVNVLDEHRYYILENGDVRTLYLDEMDGLCKSATSGLYTYSDSLGCSDILLQIADIYIAETLQEQMLLDLGEKDIYSIYLKDKTIIYNDDELVLSGLYEGYKTSYTTDVK